MRFNCRLITLRRAGDDRPPPDALPPAETGDHSYVAYLHADGVGALHAEIPAARRDHSAAAYRQAWGMREMAIATPDGHRLMIGQKI
jgi:hypothetical protein